MRISDWSSDVCSSDLYAWGALSDHTGQRVKLLRFSAAVALASSFGLWWNGGAWWLGLVLVVMFTPTRSMMSLTEARSEERRVGKACVSTCRSRWMPDHSKKKTNKLQNTLSKLM